MTHRRARPPAPVLPAPERQIVSHDPRIARDLRVIADCYDIVKHLARRYPGVYVDFTRLRERYAKGVP